MNQNLYSELRAKRKKTFEIRENDWRMGGLVYQVFVDRFAPSANLAEKKHLYPSPKTLHSWNDLPQRGIKDSKTPYWSHELAFWGGDLPSLITKIDYFVSLSIDTLYLNPIFEAYSNHKYDTLNYETISPEYGNLNDLQRLIKKLAEKNIKLILDGVFNHMALSSPKFQEALNDEHSPYRRWFVFGNEYPTGVRLWHNAPSLPELNLDHPEVRSYLFSGENSIVKRYINMGIAGWRLDTAIELGYDYLHELTTSAHEANASSVVIGELNNYPKGWSPAMDGTMNFPLRDMILHLVKGGISAKVFSEVVEKMIADISIETMLKSWVLLENHDTARIANEFDDFLDYSIAKVLQFSLPGTINLYMGEEIGTLGGDDPLNRAPMNWDKVVDQNNLYLNLHKHLIHLRRNQRALRIGDISFLKSEKLIIYTRTTDCLAETVIVVINPHSSPVNEHVLVDDPLLKSHHKFYHLFGNFEPITSFGILLPISIPGKTAWIIQPDVKPVKGYSPYKYISSSIG